MNRKSSFQLTLRAAMVLAVVLMTTATAWAQTVQFPIYEGDEGTEAKPYQIKTAADLVKLSDDVKSGTTYDGVYFKLMNDINFSPSSTWSDINSEENNFEPIGQMVNNRDYYFRGTFDGNDKTISGIRIYKGTKYSDSQHVGLFGRLKGTVKKLTLTDTRIIGYSFSGGIAGYCGSNSLIDHCTVTSTVAIYAIQHGALHYGGIVGDARGNNTKITNNTCSATVVVKDGFTGCSQFGGILGSSDSKITVSNNLAIGATVKDSSGRAGAIMPNNNAGANLTNNFYINCTVNGTVNALNVGCYGEDITENCAAVSLHTLTLNDPVTTTTPPSVNIGGTDYYGHGTAITLNITQPATYVGYIYDDSYIVNGTAISGNTFTMPAQDTEVTSSFTTVPIYKLTLADGITATGTIAATYGDDNYYLAGSTITLSTTPPATYVGYIYDDSYIVNGTVNSGNTFTMPAQDTEVTSSFTTIPIYKLTLADGITATGTIAATYDDDNYYLAGTTITLSGTQTGTPPVGYIYGDGYAVNGTAISGNTFTMPAQDTEVTSTTVPVYPLTLADGITTTTTPTITFGDTPYYLAGTTITLSGGLPDVSAENEYAAYIVNGKEINGRTFTMPAAAVTVSANIFSAEWPGDGTESTPYLIKNCHQLKLLAHRVNNAVKDADDKPYGDDTKWYKLVADIQFDYADLGETESNFEAIGKNQHLCEFYGHFLGNGHTIRGIRIRKGSEDDQGLFGHVDQGVISGVTLTDADITGKSYTGGIVGDNGGTVTDCHVTSTVIIRATADGGHRHGGIVGCNGGNGTVSGCTSAATLTIENGATDCNRYGGIAGENYGTLCDNLVLGAHFPETPDFGAITCSFSGTLLRNYYSKCTKEGGGEVYYCGSQVQDIPDNDGAVPGIALYDHSVFSGLNSQILQTVINNDDFGQPRIDLAGRTLYKDGNWNALCLPFGVDDGDKTDDKTFTDTPLEGAIVKKLDVENQWKMEDGQWIIDNENGTYQTGLDGTTLYLFFKPVSSIEAGWPYIVKWETDTEGSEGTEDTEVRNPVFQNVGLAPYELWDVVSQDGKVTFNCIYDPTQLPNDGGSNLCIGTDSQLYWPSSDEALNAFRAYLHVDGTVQAIQSNVAFGLMGDVNGNGQIDIGDAVCIVNYLVNKTNTVFKDKLADLNGNGGIDIGDAVMIVNILVGKTNTPQTTGKGLQTTGNNDPQ